MTLMYGLVWAVIRPLSGGMLTIEGELKNGVNEMSSPLSLRCCRSFFGICYVHLVVLHVSSRGRRGGGRGEGWGRLSNKAE